MKKTVQFISLIIILTLLAACAPAVTDEAFLAVGTEEISSSELEALGTTTVSYTGKDGVATDYEGVVLAVLLKDAGLDDDGSTVTFTAADGYIADMSMDEALACDTCVVAFVDDMFRTVMPEMSGKLQVKDLAKIEVSGTIEETILTVGSTAYTRSTLEAFEPVSADYINKEGKTTTYSGVSLNALLEDANLTDAAATLVFVASDGFEAEATMEEIFACTNCIVAFDDDILRMIMPDMSSKLQVKDVIKINAK